MRLLRCWHQLAVVKGETKVGQWFEACRRGRRAHSSRCLEDHSDVCARKAARNKSTNKPQSQWRGGGFSVRVEVRTVAREGTLHAAKHVKTTSTKINIFQRCIISKLVLFFSLHLPDLMQKSNTKICTVLVNRGHS